MLVTFKNPNSNIIVICSSIYFKVKDVIIERSFLLMSFRGENWQSGSDIKLSISTAQKNGVHRGPFRLVRFCFPTMLLEKESDYDEATEIDFEGDIHVGLSFGSKEEAVLIVEKCTLNSAPWLKSGQGRLRKE